MSNNLKELITDINKLSEWCIEIDTRKEGKLVQEIVLSLKETMRKNNFVYLTAPQVGYNRRIFCMRFGKNDYRTFINPLIENNTGFTFARETCNSIPNKTFIIPRFSNVKAYFTTPLGKVESTVLNGLSAQVFQHCLEHLNGMLVSDIGLEIDEMFDNATDEERAEVLKLYAESLDIKQKQLEEEIAKDDSLKDIVDATKFINSVRFGETMIENSLDD